MFVGPLADTISFLWCELPFSCFVKIVVRSWMNSLHLFVLSVRVKVLTYCWDTKWSLATNTRLSDVFRYFFEFVLTFDVIGETMFIEILQIEMRVCRTYSYIDRRHLFSRFTAIARCIYTNIQFLTPSFWSVYYLGLVATHDNTNYIVLAKFE